MDCSSSRHPEFRYKTEFQSHEPEVLIFSILLETLESLFIFCMDHVYLYSCLRVQFDYLKSLEIEEKINKIRWCHTSNGAMFLLSTNDKTVKFWKVEISKNLMIHFTRTFLPSLCGMLISFYFDQVQEKKIKKICNFNVDPQKFTSNGFISSSNVPTSSKACCANPVSCKSNNGPILPGGITSLRLPMVVVCWLVIYKCNSLLLLYFYLNFKMSCSGNQL